MGTIEAVIWDFGGVLTTSPFEAFNRYEQAHGLPNDFIRGINATNPEAMLGRSSSPPNSPWRSSTRRSPPRRLRGGARCLGGM